MYLFSKQSLKGLSTLDFPMMREKRQASELIEQLSG